MESGLLTDLYQLNMIEAYLDHEQTKTAVFELFFRKFPPQRSFLMAAGLEQALDFLEQMRFSQDDLDWLALSGRFSQRLLDYLATFRFTGDVDAMPEGTVFFANEPILRVTAPLSEAQYVETRLINILHFQSLIATKAARIVLAAPDKLLVDFGLRRAHGAEAGLFAARASYIAGFAGTATMLAEREYGVPLYGTMAHSFIEIHDDESTAFENFARSRPQNLTFLIDTYDTENGARKLVALAPRLNALGIKIGGVRLDSGDMAVLSKNVRRILDNGGLHETTIFASGGLDEMRIGAMLAAGAPIDGFGVGTSLATSSDVPALDCAFKLQEYAGIARRKRSSGKATWPGRKQVWREFNSGGKMSQDVISLEDDAVAGTPLLLPVMRNGKRLRRPNLDEIRRCASQNIAALPDSLRQLDAGVLYPTCISEALVRLASDVDRRIAQGALR
jgi:nicotinate phosphoribosyltransferase